MVLKTQSKRRVQKKKSILWKDTISGGNWGEQMSHGSRKKSRQATASSHNLKDWQRAGPQMIVSKLSSCGTTDMMRPKTRGTLITNQYFIKNDRFFLKHWSQCFHMSWTWCSMNLFERFFFQFILRLNTPDTYSKWGTIIASRCPF